MAYFVEWLNQIKRDNDIDLLSFFEQNLEVWRQLWRVVELSDILLFVVDIRHPLLHFPPSLYHYITQDLNKKMIDLVDESAVREWTNFFKSKYPELTFSTFSFYPKEAFLSEQKKEKTKHKEKIRFKRYAKAFGVTQLLKACRNTNVKKNGKIVDWDAIIDKIKTESIKREKNEKESKPFAIEKSQRKHDRNLLRTEFREKKSYEEEEQAEKFEFEKKDNSEKRVKNDDDEDSCESDIDDETETEDQPKDFYEKENANFLREWEISNNSDMLTIGLIGHPNVGKSSLINSIMAKKVVSTSKTPGHTKHFQTINLTETVRLCDCPGIVFPSRLPKPLQILSGMYKIAQVREPYSSVGYLAERVPLAKILGLSSEEGEEWTSLRICEEFALQRGFLTAKGGRPDAYRAANMILRMVNDGKIVLSFHPDSIKY